MTSLTYITTQLSHIVSLFPYLKVRYEYDAFSQSHYIEVKPLASFQYDRGYIEFEQLMRQNFMNAYPSESICFLSEDSLYEIEKPLIEKAGILYGINYQNLFEASPHLRTYQPVIETHTSYTVENTQTTGVNFVLPTSSVLASNVKESDNYAGDYSYAMAA